MDVYIGQDVQRTMTNADPGNNDTNELDTKVKLSRKLPNVRGNVWWHGYWVTDNLKGVADSLALKYQSTIALPPSYGDKGMKPEKVRNLRLVKEKGKTFLTWEKPDNKDFQKSSDPVRFVVYQFFPEEQIDIEDAETIIALTPFNNVVVEDSSEGPSAEGSTFVVTALDRMNRESDPVVVRWK